MRKNSKTTQKEAPTCAFKCFSRRNRSLARGMH
jgi:hypothetical protein